MAAASGQAVPTGVAARLDVPTERGRSLAWWGMVMTIVTEGMLFALLIFVYYYLYSIAPQWPLGDIAPPEHAGASAMAAARLLRRLKVGRGREQYALAIARRERVLALPQAADDERSPGEFAEERARDRRELAALIAVVQPLLDSTPLLAQPAGGPQTVAPAELAAGLRPLLRRVPARHSVDRTARDRLRAPVTPVSDTK